ncbi:MAG: radical SAM protein [Verrucomicrobia bacterium]|nr:radical SAM protein [Verrucomicrobiota bacterium]
MDNQPDILRYQRDRSLADVPGFSVGLQLRLPDNTKVYLALGPAEFTLTFSDDIALHYDLQGRFTKFVTLADYHRRSLSGKILHTTKSEGIRREIVADDSIIERARERVLRVLEAFSGGRCSVSATGGKGDDGASPSGIEFARPENAPELFRPLLELAAHFDIAASHADAASFRALYRDVAILPPDQYNALVFQATEGCAYHGCLFCDFYRDRSFRAKTPEEFVAHVDAVVAFHGKTHRNSIFLGEANALMLPHETLMEMLRIIHDKFRFCFGSGSRMGVPPVSSGNPPSRTGETPVPLFTGIASFVDTFTRRPDFAALAQLGLSRIYVGMETGSDELLRWLRKPATAESVVATVTAAKAAGTSVGVIVLLGAGGERFAEAHVRETVRVLNALPLGKGDYIYFSPLVVKPGSAYDAPLLSPEQIRNQEQEIRAGLQIFPKPYVARYEVEAFVY